MFMTKDDIVTLTGYERTASQINWLKSHGWKFALSRAGLPVVLVKHAEEMLTIGSEKATQEPKLNMSAIRKAA